MRDGRREQAGPRPPRRAEGRAVRVWACHGIPPWAGRVHGRHVLRDRVRVRCVVAEGRCVMACCEKWKDATDDKSIFADEEGRWSVMIRSSEDDYEYFITHCPFCGSPAGEEPSPSDPKKKLGYRAALRASRKLEEPKPSALVCCPTCDGAGHLDDGHEICPTCQGMMNVSKPNGIAAAMGACVDPSESDEELVEQIEAFDKPKPSGVGDFRDGDKPITHCVDELPAELPSALEEAVKDLMPYQHDENLIVLVDRVEVLHLIREHKRPGREEVEKKLRLLFDNDESHADLMDHLDRLGVFGREGE
eukprot:GHVU01139500.1.p1 GENE.GHVU01139500.1~~GHVU01139500.1.p1  ORF type:complete len:305 (+),score=58.06 GHVU01139500.1:1221-2135(+)